MLLIEYMPLGELTAVLEDPALPLSWLDASKSKLSIAIDISRGGQYLHGRDPPVVHRDVRSARKLQLQKREHLSHFETRR